MGPPAIEDVVLKEPLTEFTATLSVDIFDGNLFLESVLPGQIGVQTFRLAVAGSERRERAA